MTEWSERLSQQEVTDLGAQIAGLTGTGLPLPSGLRAVGEELPSGRLRRALDRLAASLESGVPLDAALESQGSRLPAHLRGLVRAGARTGKLGEVLGRFAGYASVGEDLRRGLWLSFAYPILSVVMAGAVLVFVCVFVLNGFEAVFKDFGVQLPRITRLVLWFSRLVTQAWQPMLWLIGVIAALWLLASLALGAATRRSLAASIPLLGSVWRSTSLAEFCHLLGLLLESELSLVEALPLAGEGVQDAQIGSACRAMAGDVAAGRTLSEAMLRQPSFPRGLARLLAWANSHRSLPEALHMMGEIFESRARSQARFAATVCSVMAVVSILGGIVLMVGAIFLPMIQLISRLSG